MRRALAGTVVVGLLACGGAATVEEPTSVPRAVGLPASAAPTPFPATGEGVCRLQTQCGCAVETTEECLANMNDVPVSVFACIVAQDCVSFCNGGGMACVNAWAAELEAESYARRTR